ncbi:MAG TPA: hypothetical protein VHE35_18180 [Kofleriaceae bacterium]|nr:hypothetical protein [Kofleriaceae bacterium]
MGVALALAGAACSGDDGGGVTVDAQEIDAAVDAPACTGMVCDQVCLDTSTDHDHCGSCTNMCGADQQCRDSQCACPEGFIPAEPAFVQQQISTNTLPGATLGIGGLLETEIDALIVGYPTDSVEVNHPYALTGESLGTPPFAAAGFNIDLNSFMPAAAFYATSGTVTFTKVCAAGFEGTLTDAHFAQVAGIMNPTLVPDGCSFDVPSVTFAYGDVCPTPMD